MHAFNLFRLYAKHNTPAVAFRLTVKTLCARKP